MLILASRSPQRRAILRQLGIDFEVREPDVDELESGPAGDAALENAARKARSVALHAPGRLVLGVDTVVSLDRRIYGKPADDAEARATLQALSGRTHEVTSGLCLIESGVPRHALAVTRVGFRPLTPELIEWYLAAGEWRERAGGYAIQGRGAALVTAIEGDYFNVVGLPLATLLELVPGLLGEAPAPGSS
jgi:septum formation protein